MRSLPVTGSPPKCLCGCGERVNAKTRGTHWHWNDYILGHQCRGRKRPKQAAVMRANVEKMWRGRPAPEGWSLLPVKGRPPKCACGCGGSVTPRARGRSWKWNKYIANHQMVGRPAPPHVRRAASKRMRESNPMWDSEVAARSLTRHTPMTLTERWFHEAFPEFTFIGDGSRWVNRRCPDFRLPGQKVAVEVSQRGCYCQNERRLIGRTPDGYGLDAVRHYVASGWRCLVVFLPGRRPKAGIPGLLKVVESFKTGKWSGVWDGKRLRKYVKSRDELAS